MDRLAEVKDSSRAKAEMMRQEKETPKETNFEKDAMPKEKVPIAKVRKSEAGSSSTAERSKEWSNEPNGEEEEKVLQDLVWNLKRILNEQNEYIITLRGEYNGQTLKRRWTTTSDDACDYQTTDVISGNTGIIVGQVDLQVFFWIRLGIICPSHMF